MRLRPPPALPHAAEAGALAPALGWIDDAVGIAGRARARRTVSPDPAWWVYSCELARTPAGSWYAPAVVGAAGASIDPGEALRRMLGETVERYSALTAVPSEVRRMSLRETGMADRLPTCAADEPCPASLRGADREAPLSHVAASRLADGAVVWLPSALVYMGIPRASDEPLVALQSSSGCAFRETLHAALWAAFCELVERDALMLAWWTERDLPRIVTGDAAVPAVVSARLERMRRVGREVRLLDMTTDVGIPAVLCVVSGARPPLVAVGAACHVDPARACAKAIDEGFMALVSTPGERRPVPSRTDFDWVRSLEDHAVVYADWPDSPACRLLLHDDRETVGWREFSSRASDPAPGDMRSLVATAGELGRRGLDLLWTELTAPEARGIGHAVRVVVPELVPLSIDHGVRWLGTPRLRAAARTTAGSARFNPHPHPFA